MRTSVPCVLPSQRKCVTTDSLALVVTNTKFLCLQIEHMRNEFSILLAGETEFFRLRRKLAVNQYINKTLKHRNNALVVFITISYLTCLHLVFFTAV